MFFNHFNIRKNFHLLETFLFEYLITVNLAMDPWNLLGFRNLYVIWFLFPWWITYIKGIFLWLSLHFLITITFFILCINDSIFLCNFIKLFRSLRAIEFWNLYFYLLLSLNFMLLYLFLILFKKILILKIFNRFF